MNRLNARKQAVASQAKALCARRQRIRCEVDEVTRLAREVAAKPSNLAAAGLCGAFVGYLSRGPASSTNTGDQPGIGASALPAVTRLITLLPTGLAMFNSLAGNASRSQ